MTNSKMLNIMRTAGLDMKNIKMISILLTPVLFLLPLAHATPAASSGTFTTTVASVTPVLAADGNTVLSLTGTIVVTGTFAGEGPIAFNLLVRASGQDNFKGSFNCACVVAGQSGNVVIGFTATGVFGVDNSLSGEYVILSTTGGLSSLVGQGPFSGVQTPTGFFGNYAGQNNFSP